MKNYIVSEDVLLELVRDSLELAALNCGGVDNWDWAGDSCSDYLDELAGDYNLKRNDLSFQDVAAVMIARGLYGELQS